MWLLALAQNGKSDGLYNVMRAYLNTTYYCITTLQLKVYNYFNDQNLHNMFDYPLSYNSVLI